MTRRCHKAQCRGAYVLAEAIVALVLVGIILSVSSSVITRFARSADVLLNQHRAAVAAEGQLERMRAGLLATEDADFADESGVEYRVRVSSATGEWEPLLICRVEARVSGKYGKVATHEAVGYVRSTAFAGAGQ